MHDLRLAKQALNHREQIAGSRGEQAKTWYHRIITHACTMRIYHKRASLTTTTYFPQAKHKETQRRFTILLTHTLRCRSTSSLCLWNVVDVRGVGRVCDTHGVSSRKKGLQARRYVRGGGLATKPTAILAIPTETALIARIETFTNVPT